MKKLCFAILAVLALAAGLARATLLIGSLSPIITATTNSVTFVTGSATINLPQITVSNNGLAATNAYQGSFRWSFDGVNFYTNSSPQFFPTNTTAGSITVGAQSVVVPIYVQMLATTNNGNMSQIQIGVTSP